MPRFLDRARIRAWSRPRPTCSIPPLDAHPGGARARRRRLRRQPPRRVHVRSPADLRGRSVQRSLRRRRVVREVPRRSRRTRSWRGARASKARAAFPSASSTARRAAGRRSTATASPRSAPTSATVDADEQDRRLDAQRELRAVLYDARVRRRVRRARVRRQPRSRRLARHRLRRRRATARLHRRRSDAVVPEPHRLRRGRRRHRARRRDRGRRAHERGLVGGHAREGPQPPARRSSRRSPARPRVERRDQVAAAATSSGPTRSSSPARYRRDDDDGDRLFAGEVNNLPVDRRRRRLPRRRQAPPLSRGRLQSRARSSARSRAPTSSTGPSTTTRWSRTTPKRSGSSAWPATPARNPFAEWRSGPYPMPPGADMFGAVLTTDAATRLGYHPYRAPTGVNSVPYDGRPACNNCGFCAYYGCPIEAKGDPIAPLRNALRTGRCEIRADSYVERVLLDSSGKQARGVRYLDLDGNAHEVERARRRGRRRRVGDTRACCCAPTIANSSGLVGRYLMYHFQTFVIGQFPFRLHGHRGRSVTHLHDDHMIVDDDVARVRPRARSPLLPRRPDRARRRRQPGHGRHLHRARDRAHARDARLERCATACGRSPCRARTCPRSRTASTSTRPSATCTGSRPGAPPTTCTGTRSSRRATTRRNSRPSCARPARSTTFAATSPPLEGDRAGTPQRVDVAPHHGHVPHGRRPRDERGRSVAAVPRRREHGVHRLVGVPHLDRLRSDAHDRRARDPRVPRPRGPARSSPAPVPPNSVRIARLAPMDLAALSDTSLVRRHRDDASARRPLGRPAGRVGVPPPLRLTALPRARRAVARALRRNHRPRAATSSPSAPATSGTRRLSPQDEQIPFLVLVDDDAVAATRGVDRDAQLVPAPAPAHVEGDAGRRRSAVTTCTRRACG